MSGFAAFRFIGEALRLYLNDRFGMPFTDKNKVLNVLYNAYVGIMLLAAYGIPFISSYLNYVLEYNVAVFPDISVIAANPVFLTAAFMLAIASIRYIVTYKNYPLVAKRGPAHASDTDMIPKYFITFLINTKYLGLTNTPVISTSGKRYATQFCATIEALPCHWEGTSVPP